MELVRFIVRLLCDRDFLFLFLAYGLNQAVVNAMGTLLNQVMEFYFGDASIAGYVGMTSVIGGIIGGLIFGKILDKTRRYKLVACTVYGLSAIGMTGFTFVLKTKSELLVYIVTAIFGFFLGGYMPVGFDFAIEITYPEPEAMTSGLLTLGLQVISTAATYIYGEGVRSWGVDEANYFLIGILVVGTIFNFGMKPKLKRQEAATQKESAGQP
ncbi:putative MFS-type transporter C09D4.1 [Blattella germanica]|nr:putative MFS-type transporter C09D4.1 [Blattella germanica]